MLSIKFYHFSSQYPPAPTLPCPMAQATLPHIKPFKILAETIGAILAQTSDSPIKKVQYYVCVCVHVRCLLVME